MPLLKKFARHPVPNINGRSWAAELNLMCFISSLFVSGRTKLSTPRDAACCSSYVSDVQTKTNNNGAKVCGAL